MKIEIEFPDSRFKSGDLVRLKNSANEHFRIVKINHRTCRGDFWMSDSIMHTGAYHDYYDVTVMPGSRFDHVDALPISKRAWILSRDDVDLNGELCANE